MLDASRHDRKGIRPVQDGARARRRNRDRLFLTLITLVLIVGALSTMNGTYAMWTDQVEIEAGQVSSGTSSLDVAWLADHDEELWYDVLPGESVQQSLTLTNTGDVPMELSVTVPHSTPGFEIRAEVARGDERLDCPVLGITGQPLSDAGELGGPLAIDPGQAIDVAVEITATGELAPGAEIDVTLQFDGKQIRR